MVWLVWNLVSSGRSSLSPADTKGSSTMGNSWPFAMCMVMIFITPLWAESRRSLWLSEERSARSPIRSRRRSIFSSTESLSSNSSFRSSASCRKFTMLLSLFLFALPSAETSESRREPSGLNTPLAVTNLVTAFMIPPWLSRSARHFLRRSVRLMILPSSCRIAMVPSMVRPEIFSATIERSVLKSEGFLSALRKNSMLCASGSLYTELRSE